MLNPANPNNAFKQGAAKAPRLRGKAIAADTGNTGIISTDMGSNLTMNHDDYVIYPGNPAGSNPQWLPGFMYQWKDTSTLQARSGRWVRLEFPTETNRENAAKYIEGTSKTTEGAPAALYSRAQIESLVASSIFADLVGAVDIELIEGVLNGKARQGSIRSSNFVSPVDPQGREPAGFRFKWDGILEAVRAIFKDIRITGDSHFEGDIVSGQIHSSNNRIGQDLPPKTFSSSENARDVHRYWGRGENTYQTATLGSFPISGTWGGRPVSNIVLRTYRASVGMNIYTQFIIEVTLTDTVPATVITNYYIDASGYRNTLGVNFGIEQISGAILRLFNVPSPSGQENINALPLGQVYRLGTQLHVRI